MGKYIASIALLCAVLVAAPAKADVLSAFNFDPDKYESKALVVYNYDGEGGQSVWVADPSVWSARALEEVDLGEAFGPTNLGLVAQVSNPASLAGYVSYYFGYTPASIFEGTAFVGVGTALDDLMGLEQGTMPYAPVSLALTLQDMLTANGVELLQYYEGDLDEYDVPEFGYLSIALLGDLIASGEAANLGFIDYGIPFSLTLYGVVAKGGDGEADAPEPATLALMGLGLAGLGVVRRRMKK